MQLLPFLCCYFFFFLEAVAGFAFFAGFFLDIAIKSMSGLRLAELLLGTTTKLRLTSRRHRRLPNHRRRLHPRYLHHRSAFMSPHNSV